jgi:alpha-galactosidase
MTNKDVMALARRGETFRPVEGRSGSKSEGLFVLSGKEGTYVAAFNFDAENESDKIASFARMGIDSSKGIVCFGFMEWTGMAHCVRGCGASYCAGSG